MSSSAQGHWAFQGFGYGRVLVAGPEWSLVFGYELFLFFDRSLGVPNGLLSFGFLDAWGWEHGPG